MRRHITQSCSVPSKTMAIVPCNAQFSVWSRCSDAVIRRAAAPTRERVQHALNEHGSEMPSVARQVDLPFMPLQRWSEFSPMSVQRAGGTPTPADPNYTRTKGGDAYVGPGNGGGIGGLVSYGCYCGPGGDPVTGSRCGPGAAPKDDIDAKCMRHDSDYNKAGVNSGSTPAPSTCSPICKGGSSPSRPTAAWPTRRKPKWTPTPAATLPRHGSTARA